MARYTYVLGNDQHIALVNTSIIITSHNYLCVCGENISIYSASNFQVYNTVLYPTASWRVLHPQDLFILSVEVCIHYSKSPHSPQPHPLQPPLSTLQECSDPSLSAVSLHAFPSTPGSPGICYKKQQIRKCHIGRTELVSHAHHIPVMKLGWSIQRGPPN